MACGIKDFLASLGMGRHLNMFHMRGYDDESDIPHLSVSDLQNVGVTDPMEVIIILKAAQSYKQRPEYALFCWLRENGLDHYYEGFVQSGRVLLTDVAQLSLPDEDVYDELEITLPGHKRRFERAVQALRKRQRSGEAEREEGGMVTEGWWGFPSYLPSAKYPFLCVRAIIQSTLHPDSTQSVEFMVDSGSDVATLREDVIQGLKLEPITTVRSCGAHGSVRTTMYRAFILIGDSKIETEVIGSSYDSLGSQVLRHFDHHIDSARHKWFRSTTRPVISICTNPAIHTLAQSGETEQTETVSVLQQPQQGTSYSTTQSGHREEGSCEGRGESVGKSNTGSVTDEDETDSTRLIPRQYKRDSSCLFSSHLEQSPSKHRRDSSCLFSPQLEQSPSKRRLNANNGDTTRIFNTSTTYPNRSIEMFSSMPSENYSVPERALVWNDEGKGSRTSNNQSTKPPHGGHLLISGDGTISLSFGREGADKKE